MSKELKPCPFCGGNCGARTVGYCPDTSNEDNSLENIERCKNKAIEAWNRRADDGTD